LICLKDDKNYNIAFSLAEHQEDTKALRRRGGTKQSFWWDARFGAKDGICQIKMPYNKIKRFPTFYFYLLDENDRPVAYYRDALDNYSDDNKDENCRAAPVKWRSFINNDSIRPMSKNYTTEMFSFRLFCWDPRNKKVKAFNPNKQPEW
jgi:hypothetical protein